MEVEVVLCGFFQTFQLKKMTQKELEEMHLRAFLEKREIPESIVDAVFSTPLAPRLLIEAFFSVQVFGEKEGMRTNFAAHDLIESKKAFFDFISA